MLSECPEGAPSAPARFFAAFVGPTIDPVDTVKLDADGRPANVENRPSHTDIPCHGDTGPPLFLGRTLM